MKVLFVGHEASRTGAPIALLHLMRWLKQEAGITGSCLLARGGPLAQEFRDLFPTSVYSDATWRPHSKRRRVLRKLGLDRVGQELHRRQLLANQVANADLVYCNTIAALPALELAAARAPRVVVHVHELELWFRSGVGHQDARRVLTLADRFIACSHAVADNLSTRHEIPQHRIDVVHETIPISTVGQEQVARNRRTLRESLDLSGDGIVVGGCGVMGWRKGTDLFAQVARRVQRHRRPDLHFLWLGGQAADVEAHQFQLDLEQMGLAGFVTHVPTTERPLDYLQAMDLLLLTSREDPYPLVCLEAASCGVPIVCFRNAGGMPEFVEDDAGIVVEYADVEAMAAACLDLVQDIPRRVGYGQRAAEKVRERHSITVAGPQILEVMHRTAIEKSQASALPAPTLKDS
jgi:glycosyltransferase involved in cell wall biosynthesis